MFWFGYSSWVSFLLVLILLMLECYLDIHNQWLNKCLVLLKKLVCFCICCFLYGFLIFIINGWINMLWCKSNCFAFSFFWFLNIFLTFRINVWINVWVCNYNLLFVMFVWTRTVETFWRSIALSNLRSVFFHDFQTILFVYNWMVIFIMIVNV